MLYVHAVPTTVLCKNSVRTVFSRVKCTLSFQCSQQQRRVHDVCQRPALLPPRPAAIPQPAAAAVAIPKHKLPAAAATTAATAAAVRLQRRRRPQRLHQQRLPARAPLRGALLRSLPRPRHATASNANATHQAHTARSGTHYFILFLKYVGKYSTVF